MFMRNFWYVAGWSHQFPVQQIVARTLLNDAVVLYRTAAGEVVALEDRCCHRFAPLSRGRLEGDSIRCLYHGLKFSAAGHCIEIPSRDAVPPGIGVRGYPVVEQDRWVWVWMGDAALADTALIPRAIGHDDPDYMLETSELHYAADYQLLHDNVLDLTHIGYLHETTFGANDTKWARIQPAISRVERGVRVQRWLPDHPLAGYMPAPSGTRVDQWSSHDFLLPGVLALTVASYGLGTADAFPDGPEGIEPLYVMATSHAVTPVTPDSCVCYFSVGQLARHAAPDRVRRQMTLFEKVFAEDRDMIQAQQAIVARSPGRRMMTLSFDQSVAQFRRLMATHIDAEAAAPASRGHAAPA
jgi:phenylpropionate dioxygenase-like ring-hydroxylating dioxygenase large terminal subunit